MKVYMPVAVVCKYTVIEEDCDRNSYVYWFPPVEKGFGFVFKTKDEAVKFLNDKGFAFESKQCPGDWIYDGGGYPSYSLGCFESTINQARIVEVELED